MGTQFIEDLENRRLLSHPVGQERDGGVRDVRVQDFLTAQDVETILSQAASQARPGQAIVVVDREGIILGIWGGAGLDDNVVTEDRTGQTIAFPNEADTVIQRATSRARTGGFFVSNENAFTTRTARFIIQDHFPHPVKDTPGGPLYGVQFSSFRGSDQKPEAETNFPSLSGDPGGVPIYKNGVGVGGIGVAGDGRDISARSDLRVLDLPGANPRERSFNGKEESDFDEAVALAGVGVRGIYSTPRRIQANRIFVDGLRFPFTKNRPARGQPPRSLADLAAGGAGSLRSSAYLQKLTPDVVASTPPPFVQTTLGGVPGFLKVQRRFDEATGTLVPVANTLEDQIIASNDEDAAGNLLPESQRLTEADVMGILERSVAKAQNTRALIREPDGVPMKVHFSVVDRDGDPLGIFRMIDGPNFGYDVSLQKARTAAFFSDDQHAITTRGLGFMAQLYFPIGINEGGPPGPLFNVQDKLFLAGAAQGASVNFQPIVNGQKNPLMNGITIFPGGIPLYKNGVLVGAVGASGDGVDQDEIASAAGAEGFEPPLNIRSDFFAPQVASEYFLGRLQRMVDLYDLSFDLPTSSLDERETADAESDLIPVARDRFQRGFEEFRLPYLRFPRNPEIDTD